MDKLQVFAPFDGALIDELKMHDQSDVESALVNAHTLFLDRKKWLPKTERIAILERCIMLMHERKEALVKTAAQEGGKPLMDTKVEFDRAVNGVKLAIDAIKDTHGEQIPMGQTTSSLNRLAFTIKEPLGVVVSISAFNHPINLIIHQTVTAIAAGCPVIIKPALTTPLSCMAIVNILHDAGLPKAWCTPIICSDALAENLASDSRISYLSFIGSAKVGWHLRAKLAPGVHCALEHGGVAPVIVEKDADMDDALPLLAKGAFYHAGQVCVSVQRIYAHSSICESLCKSMVAQANSLIVGDPLNESTEVGPLIMRREADRIESWVNEAINEGATLLCGGKRISDSCYQPTVLLNPKATSKVSTQEIFGPVVCIYSFDDRQEAISKCNTLPFAFQAAIFTKNIDVALECANLLKGTAVMINDHTAFRVDWMPFGGGEHSGMGVGGIKYSMNEMMNEKLIVIRSKALK